LTDDRRQSIIQILETPDRKQVETERKAPVTIRDVARAAGVSAATVSRALNGSGGRAVSAEKHALIWKAADQLQYHAVDAARRIAVDTVGPPRRANDIGLILRATYRFTDPFWSPVLEGVANEVLRQGYHVRFSFIVDDLRYDHRRRMLNSRSVDGLILIGDMGVAREIIDLDPPRHIVVIAGSDAARWESDVRYDVITMEKHAAMDTLVGHLYALGRRRLAFLGPGPDNDRRGEAFVHALARRGHALASELFVECAFLRAHAGAVDGLVCACDTIAIGAMRAAKECGLRLPSDLAMVGFDNIPFSRDLDPPLTTMQVPKELMGELAARRLIERINHPEWTPIIQTVPTTLVARSSCGEGIAD
jgi:DNA-binding LacI/PurR family transcriptional regulator